QVISQSLRVQKVLMDMETGLRGFALTRDRNYLGPYEEARRQLAPAFENMRLLLSEHPAEAERAARIGTAAEKWISRYSDTQIDRLDSGRKGFNPELGKNSMLKIRQ